MRKKIVAGNWKMNTNLESAQKLIASLSGKIKHEDCTVVVAPPFPFLRMFKEAGNDSILLGAQNCNHNESGAFTGEVSLDMLRSLSVKYVILGHSERREYFQESNELIATKVDKALEHGLTPIFCCGEPLEIRESGSYVDFVCDQIEQSLFFLSNDEISKVVVAYEPIWAIGTGKTASSEQAQEMHEAIRSFIGDKYGKEIANDIPILYGGSCKPSNAKELFALPDVDGGLIGGAALDADDFIKIAESF